MRLFPKREHRHRHKFEWEQIWNWATTGASIGRCECGEVDIHITPAGEQQIGWWNQIGLTESEARERVLAGDYPFECSDAARMEWSNAVPR